MSETMTVSEERATKTPQPKSHGDASSPPQSHHEGQKAHPNSPRHAPESPPRKMRRGPILLAILVFAAVLAGLAISGISSRSAKTAQTKTVADQAAQITVNVITPERGPASVQLDLPGQTQAYTQAPIFAQTNGYLKKWNFDIGAKVKAGDILAEIDTPEVDQQLNQARATLKQAQAALDLSRATYNRFQELFRTKVVAAQDLDNQAADFRVKEATAGADEANVRRLQALEDFKQVRVPFDGIVTVRNTDIGALINSGSGNPLFTVAKISPLRVYVNVPESMARYVREGGSAELTFTEFAGRKFPGQVVRTSGAIDPNSRTLLTEIQVPNRDGELFPGAYTVVHLQTDGNSDALVVPANVLLFRSEGAAVAVVNPEGKVEIRKVRIRRDLGSKLEIAEGLGPDDHIIVNPGDGLADGMKVKVNTPNTPDHQAVAKG